MLVTNISLIENILIQSVNYLICLIGRQYHYCFVLGISRFLLTKECIWHLYI